MADDPGGRVPADLAAVILSEEWEVVYWCKKFDCTRSELQAAIKNTGSIITEDIAAYFESANR